MRWEGALENRRREIDAIIRSRLSKRLSGNGFLRTVRIGRAACWRRSCVSTSRRVNRSRRRCSRRRAGCGCRPRRSGACCPISKRAGYLHQPHTSSGRVPTDRGYRVFVDLLLESRRPARATADVEHQLRQHAGPSPLMDDLLASVSHVVSRAARHVGFALADSHSAVLQRIEFVPLDGSRVLVDRRGARQPGDAEGRGRPGDAAVRRSGAGGQVSQHRVRRPAAASTCATP